MLLIKSVLYLNESKRKVKEPYHLNRSDRTGAWEISSSNNYNEMIILILSLVIIVTLNYIYIYIHIYLYIRNKIEM